MVNEMEDIKPPFAGNMFEYEGGMMYFPDGIDAWCRKNKLELTEIRNDGSVWVLIEGTNSWVEYPFEGTEVSRGKFGVIKNS